MPVLFCFGLGFTAQALATRLAAEGWGIIGTCRSPEKAADLAGRGWRSEEHTSELQSLMRISYAVFCLKKKKSQKKIITSEIQNIRRNITKTPKLILKNMTNKH